MPRTRRPGQRAVNQRLDVGRGYKTLLSAVPRTDPDHVSQRIILPGDVPSPADPPPGCKFHPRCRYAQEICKVEAPLWREKANDHWVACHLADELELMGI